MLFKRRGGPADSALPSRPQGKHFQLGPEQRKETGLDIDCPHLENEKGKVRLLLKLQEKG